MTYEQAIKSEIDKYKGKLKEVETDLAQPTSENVYALLTGRKYAYMEIIENLGKVVLEHGFEKDV